MQWCDFDRAVRSPGARGICAPQAKKMAKRPVSHVYSSQPRAVARTGRRGRRDRFRVRVFCFASHLCAPSPARLSVCTDRSHAASPPLWSATAQHSRAHAPPPPSLLVRPIKSLDPCLCRITCANQSEQHLCSQRAWSIPLSSRMFMVNVLKLAPKV